MPLLIARSGYSKQGGFEIYVEGERIWACRLWDRALCGWRRILQVRAGGPNLIERIEGGLLSYGNDMTVCELSAGMRLGKFVAAPGALEHVSAALP